MIATMQNTPSMPLTNERWCGIMATCKDCFHYEVCKDTWSDDNWTETTPEEIKEMFSPKGCENYKSTADVQEVKHGKWKIKSKIQQTFDVYEEIYLECPLCKRTFNVPFEFEDDKILTYARKTYPYCNCGAKMDLVGD